MLGAVGDSLLPSRSSSLPLCQSARQLNARPERKRFRVSFTPLGEIATVNGSPSISISRRISFTSFVAMPSYTPELGRTFTWTPTFKHLPRRSFRARCQDILSIPFSAVLAKARVTDETGFNQHDVRWLKDALKMRGIPLYQRQHIAKSVQ